MLISSLQPPQVQSHCRLFEREGRLLCRLVRYLAPCSCHAQNSYMQLACAQHGSSRAASHEPHEPLNNDIEQPCGKILPRLHVSLRVHKMSTTSSYFPSLQAGHQSLNSRKADLRIYGRADWRSTLCQDSRCLEYALNLL